MTQRTDEKLKTKTLQLTLKKNVQGYIGGTPQVK